MKHQELNEKISQQAVGSVSENAMLISNQVADMMRENCASNCNVNVVMLGFPKDEVLADETTAKAKLISGKPKEESNVTFKKDAEGNLIKVVSDGAESKKGIYWKETGSTLDFIPNGGSVLFKKDEHGNLIKITHQGELKLPTYSNQFQPNWSDR